MQIALVHTAPRRTRRGRWPSARTHRFVWRSRLDAAIARLRAWAPDVCYLAQHRPARDRSRAARRGGRSSRCCTASSERASAVEDARVSVGPWPAGEPAGRPASSSTCRADAAGCRSGRCGRVTAGREEQRRLFSRDTAGSSSPAASCGTRSCGMARDDASTWCRSSRPSRRSPAVTSKRSRTRCSSPAG